MKKNRMMRLACVLLVAVMLTTSIISGTFAKYVTTGSAADSARVAKFGVVISASASLFDKTYNGNTAASNGDMPGDNSVTVSATDNVVAPGTKNSAALNFGISGTPEVTVKVTITPTLVNNVSLSAGTYADMTTAAADGKYTLSSEYKPIKWTLKKDGSAVTNLSNVEFSEIVAYFNGLNSGTTLTFAPGTSLSSNTALTGYTLEWEWPFDSSNNDKADTILGDLAAGLTVKKGDALNETVAADDYNTTISVSFTVTVEQVD